ncbi:MAG: iron-containing alcohol dehydrogenase family protein [Bacillota bacterium]|nr:iron-containing alcohol dehydrogenase family protein [Bacillota bacterium]
MVTIKTPQNYIYGNGVLEKSGQQISKIGKNALIIGGKTALNAASNVFINSLKEYDIEYDIKELTGYPTRETISKFSSIVLESNKDVIIGVGGGKALDTAKAVGEKTKRPVVTIPTIAATCASWASISILYNEEGRFSEFGINQNSPLLILADSSIIANAPVRYLNAGIGDTIVKWYEFVPNLNINGDDINLKLSVKNAELALDILKSSGVKAQNEVINHSQGKAFDDVIDSVIFLAGLVGSIQGENPHGGFAHPFYNSVTLIPETRNRLHGEKVIFGLIVQLVLEKKSEEEIKDVLTFVKKFNLPFTLSQIGIIDNIKEKVEIIADDIVKNNSFYKTFGREFTKEEIEKAIFKADEIGREQQ